MVLVEGRANFSVVHECLDLSLECSLVNSLSKEVEELAFVNILLSLRHLAHDFQNRFSDVLDSVEVACVVF